MVAGTQVLGEPPLPGAQAPQQPLEASGPPGGRPQCEALSRVRKACDRSVYLILDVVSGRVRGEGRAEGLSPGVKQTEDPGHLTGTGFASVSL